MGVPMSIPEKNPLERESALNVPLSPSVKRARTKQENVKTTASAVGKVAEQAQVKLLSAEEIDLAIRFVNKHELLAKRLNIIDPAPGFVKELRWDIKIDKTAGNKEQYELSGKDKHNRKCSHKVNAKEVREWADLEKRYEQRAVKYEKVGRLKEEECKKLFETDKEGRFIIHEGRQQKDLAILTYCTLRNPGIPAYLEHEILRVNEQGFIVTIDGTVTKCRSIEEYLKQHPYIDHERGFTKDEVFAKAKVESTAVPKKAVEPFEIFNVSNTQILDFLSFSLRGSYIINQQTDGEINIYMKQLTDGKIKMTVWKQDPSTKKFNFYNKKNEKWEGTTYTTITEILNAHENLIDIKKPVKRRDFETAKQALSYLKSQKEYAGQLIYFKASDKDPNAISLRIRTDSIQKKEKEKIVKWVHIYLWAMLANSNESAEKEVVNQAPAPLKITERMGMERLNLHDRKGNAGAFLIRALPEIAFRKPIIDGMQETLTNVIMYCDARDSNKYKQIFYSETADGLVVQEVSDDDPKLLEKLPHVTLQQYLECMAKADAIYWYKCITA